MAQRNASSETPLVTPSSQDDGVLISEALRESGNPVFSLQGCIATLILSDPQR